MRCERYFYLVIILVICFFFTNCAKAQANSLSQSEEESIPPASVIVGTWRIRAEGFEAEDGKTMRQVMPDGTFREVLGDDITTNETFRWIDNGDSTYTFYYDFMDGKGLHSTTLIYDPETDHLLHRNSILYEERYIEPRTSGDYQYILLNNGTAEITKYQGWARELIIPTALDG